MYRAIAPLHHFSLLICYFAHLSSYPIAPLLHSIIAHSLHRPIAVLIHRANHIPSFLIALSRHPIVRLLPQTMAPSLHCSIDPSHHCSIMAPSYSVTNPPYNVTIPPSQHGILPLHKRTKPAPHFNKFTIQFRYRFAVPTALICTG